MMTTIGILLMVIGKILNDKQDEKYALLIGVCYVFGGVIFMAGIAPLFTIIK